MHLALGSWAAALVDLQLVIGLGQQSAEVYNDRGVCSYETGAFDKALEDFNQAIELNPSYAQAYTNRGNCLRKQAKTAQAADDYTKAIEMLSKDGPDQPNILRTKDKITKPLPNGILRAPHTFPHVAHVSHHFIEIIHIKLLSLNFLHTISAYVHLLSN